MSEKDKMLKGEWFICSDEGLARERDNAKKVIYTYNKSQSRQERQRILKIAFKKVVNDDFEIEPPVYFDYGYHIELGKNFYANCGCIFLDAGLIAIGDNVMLGPNVQLLTSTHPLDSKRRNQCLEKALPITIGNNVWIGGGAIICPGVAIGDNAVVGAGAVVTKNVAANVLVAGNPASIIKSIE